jgi:acyl-CoA carboxylase epsilon subunit-like protein
MSAVELARGGATPEEMAALVAVIASLGERRAEPVVSGYAAWRRQRLAALRDNGSASRSTHR